MKFFGVYIVFIISFLATGFAQETTHTVYFNRNSSNIISINTDSIIKQLDSVAIDSIGVYGYSDYLGNKDYNKKLSKKRAENVFDVLKKLNHQKLNIYLKHPLGFGEIHSPFTTPEGIPKDRKVTIVLHTTPVKHGKDISQKRMSFKAEEGMEFNTSYILEKVYFVGNKPDVIEASIPQLEDIYNQIKQLETAYKLVINGHICCLEENATEEDKVFSRVLSTARALRVKEFLVQKGISEELIDYKGYSFDEPLVFPELNASDKQKNRRIEIVVYK